MISRERALEAPRFRSKRSAWWLIVPAAAAVSWLAIFPLANRTTRRPLAQAAPALPQESSSTDAKLVNLLYTVNNLGYTSTCG